MKKNGIPRRKTITAKTANRFGPEKLADAQLEGADVNVDRLLEFWAKKEINDYSEPRHYSASC